jgi:hypothetical protein
MVLSTFFATYQQGGTMSKEETELDEMYDKGIYENAEWIHGKDYGETYHEILDEENNNG